MALAPDVDNAALATLEEIVHAHFCTGLQGKRFACRHDTADDDSVDV